MKILNNHEIRIAEQLLVKHKPKSLKVYGFLFALNRTKGSRPPSEISVDAWPELNVIVCRTQTENKSAPEERVSFFCMDEQMLSTILKEDDVVDWRASFSFAGIDNSYSPLLKDISSQRGSSFRSQCHMHLLHLTDFDSLLLTEHSEDHFRISSLNDSNIELVNKTWKFGGDEDGGRHIKNMIGNFPSCCIIDDLGQPVSWILLYDYCAMGMLHTLPAHRGKGYAKALVSCMARKLRGQGFPVYCFVEEENTVSYRLFKNLGFVGQKMLRYGKSIHSVTTMKILNNHEIRIADRLLQKHIPKSLKVCGLLFALNRTQGSRHAVEICVDAWPEFNLIVCRPQTENKNVPENTKWVSLFCTDEQILSNMLKEDEIIDWSGYCMLAGIDTSHNQLFKEISSQRGSSFRGLSHVHLLHLTDFDSLLSTEHSEDHFRISSLNDSHVELVNTTWKFGGDEKGVRRIKKMISNSPSCCIIDDLGQPVSWILLYDYCAMGMLHTLPAHRGKGYAKALVSCMARKLRGQGFPVYCFVEEENTVSYRLFKNLGFVEDPSYRAAWWECNF